MKLRISLRRSIAVLLVTGAIAAPAAAQYVWIDSNNIRNYSDKPPPASVPANRIIKTPHTKAAALPSRAQGTGDTNADKAPSAANVQRPGAADKSAADKKKKAEQAEKDKQATEAAKNAEIKARNCERAREYQRTLDSGQRIARTDKDGQRAYLTDAQRSQEQQEVRRMLSECQ